MQKVDFTHLHVHSHYSLLDGACKIKDLVQKAKDCNMSELAITDHGCMYGTIEFYTECMANGIKPIIGYEAYLAPTSMNIKEKIPGEDVAYHLTLLAKNKRGYKNLLKLATAASLDGFYFKPRIDLELLAQHSEGLVCLSGCMSGKLSKLLLNDKWDEARTLAGIFEDIFGKDNFYLEVQNNDLAEQKTLMNAFEKLSRQTDLQLVATNDIHYMSKEDYLAHEALLCINTGKLLSNEDRMSFRTNEFYFKTYEEMQAMFRHLPEALANTKRIAQMCNLELSFGEHHKPVFTVDDEKTSNLEFFDKLCKDGLAKKIPNADESIKQRLEHEKDVIKRMGFVDYFLIVWDFIRFAKEHAIPVGPGRGSVCGSLVAYAMDITNINPLKYDILFERFLDESRKQMPDIDVDFCQDRRGEVINYVRSKYGAENVAQIITFGKMMAKAVVRDVGRVLDMPLPEVDKIAKLIPDGCGLTDALKQVIDLRQLYDNSNEVKQLFDIAVRLEGLARHASTHAAGVVIADKELKEYVALQRTGDDIVTQYDMTSLEKIGLLKMDFLGLKTLTLIDKAVKNVQNTRDRNFDINTIPLNDEKTFHMLARGKSIGVFQFESEGFRDLLQKMKPDNFSDIIASVALYRPGPLQGGMVDEYIQRKHGLSKVDIDNPVLKEVLRETYGIMVYQDQVMVILNRLGNIPMSEAYTLIKAISKKKNEVIEQSRQKFIEGALKNGLKDKEAHDIFNLITYFGGYGFNKSHSAAYAYVSFQTAYLKAHYPVEFMTALLSCEMGNTDKVARYIEESRALGIEVLPPDINESYSDFTSVGSKIRFGLAAVKNVGVKAVEAIIDAREKGGKFASIYDFTSRVELKQVNKTVVESLVKCGAFDSLKVRKSQLLAVVESAIRHGMQLQKDKLQGQKSLFGATDNASQAPVHYPDIPEWSEPIILQHEKALLGFYISSHPLTRYEKELRTLASASTNELSGMNNGDKVTIGGLITKFKITYTRNGKSTGSKMAVFSLEDLDGTVDCVIFPNEYDKYKNFLKNEKIVFVRGTVDLRRETPSIKIQEVIPIEKSREVFSRVIRIHLNCAGLERSSLEKLKNVLSRHKGTCPVILDFLDHHNRIESLLVAKDFYAANSPELEEEVSKIAGDGHFSFN